MNKRDFFYELPEHLIAQYPLAERSASRMLCLNRQSQQLCDRYFRDIVDLCRPGDLMVFNNTRVIPARLFAEKETGGKVEILIERIESEHSVLAHVRASKTPKPGAILSLSEGHRCCVTERQNDLFRLAFLSDAPVTDILQQIGHMPLPPYIERADEVQDQTRYQTVFARQDGAVAAPTAGLHFDQSVLDALTAKGVVFAYVTLHVGSGTFRPVRVDDLSQHVMHQEFYSVAPETVEAVGKTRGQGGRVIAIGTTSVRALESASCSGQLLAGQGDTRLFITPGYRFNSVDALLTNFHLPESTLVMLVSAFAGHALTMEAYRHAVQQEYRFFSYGDAMWIE